MMSMANSIDRTIICRAERDDLPEILALQKVAYQSEAEIYGDDSLPALQQSLTEIQKDFDRGLFLKAVVNGKIIGSVRGYQEGDTAHLLRCSVHPYFRGRGVAARLANEIEKEFPGVKRFEAFTGDRSKRNLHIYGKLGYKVYKSEPSYTPSFRWVYMEKMKP
ncbi:MAG: GNAT family N-acetyltransferase [Verrucomicrobiota bacterium]